MEILSSSKFSFHMINVYSNPIDEELLKVIEAFPGCIGISFTPPFLVVLWIDLPMML